MLTVYATQKQHDAIQKYLDDVSKQSSTQVLIEAKVVEVSLSDKFRAGIDWSQDLFKFNSPDADTNFASMATVSNPAMKIFGGDINIAVDAMSKFGSTKAISSPRIHAMNNQKASLNFAEKLVYFKVEAQQSAQGTTTGTAASTVATTVTSTKQEENVGVQIEITPSINLKTGETLVEVDPKYFRPAEVEQLLGNPTKAKTVLGWKPKITFEELVKIMVEHDCPTLEKQN